MNDERLAYEFINKTWQNKGPCLVPNANVMNSNSTLLSCHENDFCQCDMTDAFIAGLKAERERSKKLVEALVNISLDATDLTAWEQAKTVLQEYEGL